MFSITFASEYVRLFPRASNTDCSQNCSRTGRKSRATDVSSKYKHAASRNGVSKTRGNSPIATSIAFEVATSKSTVAQFRQFYGGVRSALQLPCKAGRSRVGHYPPARHRTYAMQSRASFTAKSKEDVMNASSACQRSRQGHRQIRSAPALPSTAAAICELTSPAKVTTWPRSRIWAASSSTVKLGGPSGCRTVNRSRRREINGLALDLHKFVRFCSFR